MPTLIEVLNLPQLSAFMTAQQCLDWLNTTTSQPKTDEPYSYSGVGVAFAQANIDMSIQLDVRAFVLSLIGGGSMDAYLTSKGGLDFRLPGVQAQLAANFSATSDSSKKAAIQVLIDAGQPVETSNWQLLGLVSQPQFADIQSILLQRMLSNVISLISQSIQSGSLTTVSGVFAAIAAQEDAQITSLGS